MRRLDGLVYLLSRVLGLKVGDFDVGVDLGWWYCQESARQARSWLFL